MSSDGQSSGLRTVAITALVIPALILAAGFKLVVEIGHETSSVLL